MAKKLCVFFVIIIYLVNILCLNIYANEYQNVRLLINGNEVVTEQPAVIYNDRTVIPLRVFMEYLDCDVKWIAETKNVIITTNDTRLDMMVGSHKMTVTRDGETYEETSDTAPVIINSRTMVPVIVSYILGYIVDWDSETKAINIHKIGDEIIMNSASMEPTFKVNDRIYSDNGAYVFKKPERYDIVFFKYPDDESIHYFKRIIGMPGETIEIKDGNVYISGETEPLRCDFTNGPMDTSDLSIYPAIYKIPKMGDNIADYTGIANTEVYDKDGDGKFDEDCYFIMGDNRNNSSDSRFWANTYLSKDKIEGQALLISGL